MPFDSAGPDGDDKMAGYLPHRTFNLNWRGTGVDTDLHSLPVCPVPRLTLRIGLQTDPPFSASCRGDAPYATKAASIATRIASDVWLAPIFVSMLAR